VPGRFPLLTDENVPGPIVDGLRSSGWNLVRVVDVFGEKSVDETVMAWANEQGRVIVSTDTDCLAIGHRWTRDGRLLRLIFWPQFQYQRTPVGSFLAAFDALAAKDNAFVACIEYLEVSRHL
jgi:hypothetical protein